MAAARRDAAAIADEAARRNESLRAHAGLAEDRLRQLRDELSELAQGLDHVLDGGRAADEANVGDDADVLPLESLARTREEARSAP